MDDGASMEASLKSPFIGCNLGRRPGRWAGVDRLAPVAAGRSHFSATAAQLFRGAPATPSRPLGVFFDSPNATTGPAGVALDFLRPQPTTGTALLSLALILGLAAAILAAAHALNARTGE